MINYKDELYVRAFRCWLIVSTLELANLAEINLTIDKCSFVDYLISNPSMLKKCLSKFERELKLYESAETLYPSNIEFGDYQEKDAFTKSALFLERLGYIKITKVENSFRLSKGLLELPVDQEPAKLWINQILLLKPLLSKSISILHKSILSEIDHE
jgi:hypothetical protein